MTILVDTGVLYVDHNKDASRHEAASAALESVYDGDFGHPYVSDYIYDESVILTLMRSNNFSPAKHLGEKLRGAGSYPQVYEMLWVSAAVFADAIEIFEQYDGQALSVTDATTVALCHRHNLDAVMSFDDDFDGIVHRIDPITI